MYKIKTKDPVQMCLENMCKAGTDYYTVLENVSSIRTTQKL